MKEDFKNFALKKLYEINIYQEDRDWLKEDGLFDEEASQFMDLLNDLHNLLLK